MNIFKNINLQCFTKTVGDQNEVDDLMRIILVIQRMFGLHILSPNWTFKRYALYQIATISLVVYVFIGTREVLKETNDITIIAEGCYTFIVCVVFSIKYFVMTYNISNFRKLYSQLKSTFYEIIKEDSEERLTKFLRNGKTLLRLLLVATNFPLLTYELRVLWYYMDGQRVTLSRTTATLMPMKWPYYEIGIFLHTVYMFEMAFFIMQVDIWFVFFMSFFGVTSDVTARMLSVDSRREDEDETEYAIRLNNSLRRFYTFHVQQIDFLNTLNDTYKWLTVVPQVSVALCICIILLLMSKDVEWTFALNVVPVIGELYIFSWFGEQIKNQAIEWNTALLNFDWTNLRAKDKISYYLLITFMNNKAFGVQPAIGSELALVTMSYVLKFSYQVYTVLQTMD